MLKNSNFFLFLSPLKFGHAGNFWTVLRKLVCHFYFMRGNGVSAWVQQPRMARLYETLTADQYGLLVL